MMKQVINELKERLSAKKERYNRQLKKQEDLKISIRNTENDIQQIEYTLHQLEATEKGLRKQRAIPHSQITDFFIRITRLFDRLQHRLGRSFNYRTTCMLIYGRYRIRNWSHLPGREYLRFETVLTYFKRERAMI